MACRELFSKVCLDLLWHCHTVWQPLWLSQHQTHWSLQLHVGKLGWSCIFSDAPGFEYNCQFIQIQLLSWGAWHCLVWQSKAGLRAWIDCRVKFPPTPRWDLNSIGGPPRTRVWAGRRVTGGDLGGPAEETWGGPSNSNMLNLRTIPLSKTEPNSEYKLRLISENINNW